MGLFNKKPCSNCGSKKFHRECFSGGTRSTLFIDAKTIENIHKTVDLNRAQGKDPFKGLSKEQRQIYMNQRPN